MLNINFLRYIILVSFIAIFSFCDSGGGRNRSQVLNSIPLEGGVIILSDNFVQITDYLNKKSDLFANIKKLQTFKTVASCIADADTIIKSDDVLKSCLNKKNSAVAFVKQKSSVGVLFNFELSENTAQVIRERIILIGKNKKYSVSKRDYDKVSILSLRKAKEEFHYAYCNGVLISSTSDFLVECSIRQLNSKNSICENPDLDILMDYSKSSSTAQLIVNHKILYQMLKANLNTQYQQRASNIANLTDWQVFDINLSNQNILLSGYAKDNKKTLSILNLFENQDAQDHSFCNYLPNRTVYFSAIGFSDLIALRNNFFNRIKNKNIYQKYLELNNIINNNYGKDAQEWIFSQIEKRAVEFTVDYNLAGKGFEKYILAKVKNPQDFENNFVKLTEKFAKVKNLSIGSIMQNVKSSKGKNFRIFKLAVNNIPISIFGDMICNANCTYMTTIDDYIIFAKDTESLKEYINAIENKKNLNSNSTFAEYAKNMPETSNLYYYVDVCYTMSLLQNWLSSSIANDMINNSNALANIRGAASCYSYYKEDLYLSSASINYCKQLETDRYTAWFMHLDTNALSKPMICKVHNTSEKEILLMDKTLKIYQISKEGRVRWKKQMAEPLTGKIYQIDYLNNGKLQYLFATENFLHLIDRNGNYLDNFPVKIPAKISSEISVYDYDGDRNYRIFVPCEDNKLYLYSKYGTPVEQWEPFESKSAIISKVKYFRIGENDYLVCADKLKTYILNRRGEPRINVNLDFPKSKNSEFYVESPGGLENARFVTTSSSGEIITINLSGNVSKTTIKNYSAEHNFVLCDINHDGNSDYIFSDNNQLEVFDNSKSPIFSKYFDYNINGEPMIFNFSASDTRIGTYSEQEGKIYLYKSDGQICKGFPLEGTTAFSISTLNNPNKYSVVCGGWNKMLYNYYLQ